MSTKKTKAPKSKAPTIKLDTSPEKQTGPVVRGRLTRTKDDGYVILLDRDPENLWPLVQAYHDGVVTSWAQRRSCVTVEFTVHPNDISQLAIEAQPRTVGAQKVIDDNKMQELLDKHKKFEETVVDLLLSQDITLDDIKKISQSKYTAGQLHPAMARRLLGVGIAALDWGDEDDDDWGADWYDEDKKPTPKPEKIPPCPRCGAEGLGDRDGKYHCSNTECEYHRTYFSPYGWTQLERKPNMDQYKKSVTPKTREHVLSKQYRRASVADESCVWHSTRWHNTRETFVPLATFRNETGGVIQVVQDDGQFVVAEQVPGGGYKPIPCIPREIAQHLNTLCLMTKPR